MHIAQHTQKAVVAYVLVLDIILLKRFYDRRNPSHGGGKEFPCLSVNSGLKYSVYG
jgi:hypothetical protein